MKTIDISEETYEKIKEQLGVEQNNKSLTSLKDMVGRNWFIRTVTYHTVGKVEAIFENILVLSSASWVADSGRFMQALRDGILNEVEPTGETYINTASIVDFFPWNHRLPDKQK